MYILYQQWPAGGDSSKQKTAQAQKSKYLSKPHTGFAPTRGYNIFHISN